MWEYNNFVYKPTIHLFRSLTPMKPVCGIVKLWEIHIIITSEYIERLSLCLEICQCWAYVGIRTESSPFVRTRIDIYLNLNHCFLLLRQLWTVTLSWYLIMTCLLTVLSSRYETPVGILLKYSWLCHQESCFNYCCVERNSWWVFLLGSNLPLLTKN